jgi:hypothetical protein
MVECTHQYQILEAIAIVVGLQRVVSFATWAFRSDVANSSRKCSGCWIHQREGAFREGASIARYREKALRGGFRHSCHLSSISFLSG